MVKLADRTFLKLLRSGWSGPVVLREVLYPPLFRQRNREVYTFLSHPQIMCVVSSDPTHLGGPVALRGLAVPVVPRRDYNIEVESIQPFPRLTGNS